MSIFNRINSIEKKINSIEGRIMGTPDKVPASTNHVGGKAVQPPAGGPSFEHLVNSLADDEKFKPGASSSTYRPSVQQQMNSASVKPMIDEASKKYGVDAALIEAVVKQESAYNATAESHCGAQGLMQLMPGTAKDLGVANAWDPRENIMGGTKYLSQLIDQFDGNLTKAIAGYNAGPGNVMKYGGVPPFAETQDYVKKVLNNYEEFKS